MCVCIYIYIYIRIYIYSEINTCFCKPLSWTLGPANFGARGPTARRCEDERVQALEQDERLLRGRRHCDSIESLGKSEIT